jgi:hypothetical protein
MPGVACASDLNRSGQKGPSGPIGHPDLVHEPAIVDGFRERSMEAGDRISAFHPAAT